MKLADLVFTSQLKDPNAGLPQALATLDIQDVTCDSRTIVPGSLFLAIQGHAADGHAYIARAMEQGAVAVVAQYIPKEIEPAQTSRIVLVKDSRLATALAAARFYGFPSREMILVGVTGTNGKTTITWLLEQIFRESGFNPGVIGTVNIRYEGVTRDNPVTTPDAVVLQKTLREMRDAGVTHAVMEVSSHSLDQFRVEGCHFAACIYTNLTQDHLDYHKTLEAYFASKKRLFFDFIGPDSPNPDAPAVINMDDPWGRELAGQVKAPLIRVSHTAPADLRATQITDNITGLHFTLETPKASVRLASRLTGRFNLENILCAAGAALGLGIDLECIARGIQTLDRVPGRLEKLPVPLNRHIFVDYAHSPGALESILSTLAKRVPARLITVFGCGGDRDRTKRGPMGLAACNYSDIAIVTSDNPRTEPPEAIVRDIVTALEAAGIRRLDPDHIRGKGYLVEVDREKALNLALDISQPQDTIVAAGKGHETYQITNTGTIHFDDAEKLTQACQRLITPMDWSVPDLEKALGIAPCFPVSRPETRFTLIGTDSRTIEPGMVFLALAGEKFDGHDFIPQLLDRGITGFVVRKGFIAGLDDGLKTRIRDMVVLEAADTLAALGRLAAFQRNRGRAKVVAITGSNGKTSTRKMTRDIFATTFDILATQGNLNNEIGLPLTLLTLSRAHEWAILEMGMNHPGEISRLTAMARPDIAMITNTSGAHLAGLKTPENVARAKSEIFETVSPGCTAVLFSDDPRKSIMEAAARSNPDISQILSFGTSETAGFRVHDLETAEQGLEFSVTAPDGTHRLSLRTPARFMANNAAAAVAVARTAGISWDRIQQGLGAFAPVKGRMNLSRLSFGPHLIDDTYNANPASMTQALTTLGQLAGHGRGFAALGDMLELGPDSARFHREIGYLVAGICPEKLYLFGTETAYVMAGALEKGFPEDRIFKGTKEAIAKDLAQTLVQQMELNKDVFPWLLLKGSRGMAMETLIPAIETQVNQLTAKKA